MDQPQNPQEPDFISIAVLDKETPKIYFNGFATGMGNSDVIIVLQSNSKPTTVLNTSFTIAKTLAKKLNELIDSLEKASGNTIMTTDDINNIFKPHSK